MDDELEIHADTSTLENVASAEEDELLNDSSIQGDVDAVMDDGLDYSLDDERILVESNADNESIQELSDSAAEEDDGTNHSVTPTNEEVNSLRLEPNPAECGYREGNQIDSDDEEMSERQSSSRVASPKHIQPSEIQRKNLGRMIKRTANRKKRSLSRKDRRPVNDSDSVITESSQEPCSSSTITRASQFQRSSTGISHTGSSDLDDDDSYSTIEPTDSFYRVKETALKGVEHVIACCWKEIKANERINTAYTLRSEGGYYPDQADDIISPALGALKNEILRKLDEEEQIWKRRLEVYFDERRSNVRDVLKRKSADIYDRGTELDKFFDILDRNDRLVNDIRLCNDEEELESLLFGYHGDRDIEDVKHLTAVVRKKTDFTPQYERLPMDEFIPTRVSFLSNGTSELKRKFPPTLNEEELEPYHTPSTSPPPTNTCRLDQRRRPRQKKRDIKKERKSDDRVSPIVVPILISDDEEPLQRRNSRTIHVNPNFGASNAEDTTITKVQPARYPTGSNCMPSRTNGPSSSKRLRRSVSPNGFHNNYLRADRSNTEIHDRTRHISASDMRLDEVKMGIDQATRKGVSRYMSIKASHKYRKELLICDIKDSEVILWNVSEQKIRKNINADTLHLDKRDFKQPSAACFISLDNKRSSTVSNVGILCLNFIYVVQIAADDRPMKVYCKFKIDPPRQNRAKETFLSINVGIFQVTEENGVGYIYSLNINKCAFERWRIPDEVMLDVIDVDRTIKINNSVKSDIGHCRFICANPDKNRVTCSIMGTRDNTDRNSLIRLDLKSGHLDQTFQNNGRYRFPQELNITQSSGICEYGDELLVCDCGNKAPGRNRIFLIGTPSRESGRPQGQIRKINLYNDNGPLDVRPVDIVRNRTHIFLSTHPLGKNTYAKVMAFKHQVAPEHQEGWK